MKKVCTILIAILMIAGVNSALITAYAAPSTSVYSVQTTEKKVIIKDTLNGEHSNNTTYEPDPKNPGNIKFTYTGDGELQGWEFPNAVEGVDYVVVEEGKDYIIIKILDNFEGEFWVNAKDDAGPSNVDKDTSNKSPGTGATVGIGVAGAGICLLAVARKRK